MYLRWDFFNFLEFSQKVTWYLFFLQSLHIANSWEDIPDASRQNEDLKQRVNQYIGDIWKFNSETEIDAAKECVKNSLEACNALIELFVNAEKGSYNFSVDPKCFFRWMEAKEFAKANPMDLDDIKSLQGLEKINALVVKLIKQFKQLVENNGLNKLLWHKGKRQHERVAQSLFYCMSLAYCEAHDIDITTEANAGKGPVDFKFSSGFSTRVLVEIKLSSNPKLVKGYSNQLEKYRESEKTFHATYLIIDVGLLTPRKRRELNDAKSKLSEKGIPSKIEFVDGNLQESPSK